MQRWIRWKPKAVAVTIPLSRPHAQNAKTDRRVDHHLALNHVYSIGREDFKIVHEVESWKVCFPNVIQYFF
jgi:hypothetical protein